MLRLTVLLVTHLSMLAVGVGLALIMVRGRRQALDARAEALDTHEIFLELRSERDHGVSRGRHRARPVSALSAVMPRPSAPTLTGANLAQAEVILATQRAQRVQERRAFVDLMSSMVGPARIRTHAMGRARVA